MGQPDAGQAQQEEVRLLLKGEGKRWRLAIPLLGEVR
jgi:hypothetical protein